MKGFFFGRVLSPFNDCSTFILTFWNISIRSPLFVQKWTLVPSCLTLDWSFLTWLASQTHFPKFLRSTYVFTKSSEDQPFLFISLLSRHPIVSNMKIWLALQITHSFKHLLTAAACWLTATWSLTRQDMFEEAQSCIVWIPAKWEKVQVLVW